MYNYYKWKYNNIMTIKLYNLQILRIIKYAGPRKKNRENFKLSDDKFLKTDQLKVSFFKTWLVIIRFSLEKCSVANLFQEVKYLAFLWKMKKIITLYAWKVSFWRKMTFYPFADKRHCMSRIIERNLWKCITFDPLLRF